jgi:thiamine biosynthesis lipoprotein
MRTRIPVSLLLFLILPVLFSFSDCRESLSLYKKTFTTMSTYMSVGIYAAQAPDWPDIEQQVAKWAREYNHRLPGTPIYLLNRTGTSKLPPYLVRVLKLALKIAHDSNGAFDPTILPLLKLWDFDEGGRLPPLAEIKKAMPLVNYKKVRIDPDNTVHLPAGMGLDLGGIAKGAVVDFLSGRLGAKGYTNYLIDAGGDLLLVGSKPDGSPWKIAIRHPRYTEGKGDPDFMCVLSIDTSQKNKAVVTSGDYERFFFRNGKRYHHIIDPSTGYPASGLVSVTVIADTCAEADALATAAFVLGPEKAKDFIENHPGAEALFIREKNNTLRAAKTSGFPVKLSDLRL